jgi:hypothetical protein
MNFAKREFSEGTQLTIIILHSVRDASRVGTRPVPPGRVKSAPGV